MTGIDVAILALVALSTAIAAWRGLVRSLLSLAGFVGAIVAALWLGTEAASVLPEGWGPPIRLLVGFVIVFVAVLVIATLLGWIASRLVAAAGLSGVDRVLGAVFGALRGVLVVGVVTFVLARTPFAAAEAWQRSVLLPYVGAAIDAVLPRPSEPSTTRMQV